MHASRLTAGVGLVHTVFIVALGLNAGCPLPPEPATNPTPADGAIVSGPTVELDFDANWSGTQAAVLGFTRQGVDEARITVFDRPPGPAIGPISTVYLSGPDELPIVQTQLQEGQSYYWFVRLTSEGRFGADTDSGVWSFTIASSDAGVPVPDEPVTISGLVEDGTGTGIAGVVISVLDGAGSTTTDENGFYSLEVPDAPPWSGALTLSDPCYDFDPSSRTYANLPGGTLVDQDYTGTFRTVTLSGRVVDANGVGLAGVMLDGLPGSLVTELDGSYSVAVECGWSGNVTPQSECYGFDPISLDYTDVQSDQTDRDYAGTLRAITISGYVRRASGAGISGVVLFGLPGVPSTDADGFYSASVDCGWSGIADPSKLDFRFDPSRLS
jgi:hypothetical protein